MTYTLRKLFAKSLLLLISSTLYAAPPHWEIVPNESSITFTATQNNSPVAGQFKDFNGNINFDPTQLTASSIEISVDMASVSTSYKDIANTLKTSDWFDIKFFPKAIFKATHFTKTGDNTYLANGTLTIRDKTVPTVLNFTLEEYTQTKARATGSTLLKRTVFGIGQGEWFKTNEIKDDVKVDFTISAKK